MVQCKMTMCNYGSCREEWPAKGDSGSGARKYCKEHVIPARKEYQSRRYYALKPPKKMCDTCGLLTYYKYCNNKCYPRYTIWQSHKRFKKAINKQLDLTKGMLLAMRVKL
jgi:hypothetical protein